MTGQPATCRDCGKEGRVDIYKWCAECRNLRDTCQICGDDLHLHFPEDNRDHIFTSFRREVAP